VLSRILLLTVLISIDLGESINKYTVRDCMVMMKVAAKKWKIEIMVDEHFRFDGNMKSN